MITKKRGRPRKEANPHLPVDTPEKLPEVVTESDTPTADEKKLLLAFYFDENGKVDFDRMHGRKLEQLKEVLALPEISALIGKPQTVPEISRMFEPEWAGTFLDGIFIVSGVIAKKFSGISSEACSKAFKLTPTEKEMASPIFAKIIDKYVDRYKIDFVKEFKEEIVLVIMVSAMMKTKFSYARELDAMAKKRPSVMPMDGEVLQGDTASHIQ